MLSFCEPVSATTLSHEHIREHNDPRRLGGGVVTPTLCGRDLRGGWDLNVEVTAELIRRGSKAEVNPTCPTCASIALSLLPDA